jgi:hypothetical protein
MGARRLRKVRAVARRFPWASFVRQRARRVVFVRDLRRLHDVLATTPLAGHYSMCGGLLLGWARDGTVLLDDLYDADFVYAAEHALEFDSAAQALARAGFEPDVRYLNNEGHAVEHRFRRHTAKFEFFALWRVEGRVRYFMYDGGNELVCERADQQLVPFQFLGRSWLKPADHDAALTANYGDWRTPLRNWHFSDAGTVIQRHAARFAHEKWDPTAGEAALS